MVNAMNGKRVLVTGAANGIGRATAASFVAEGAKVIGLDLVEGRGTERIIRCDLTREADIISAVAQAAKELGGIDVLVNNAGIMKEASVPAITAEADRPAFRRQCQGRHPGDARGAAPHAGWVAHHQHRLRTCLSGPGQCIGLLRIQGRDTRADAIMGPRVCAAHSRQCRGPRANGHATACFRYTDRRSEGTGNSPSIGPHRQTGRNRVRGSVSRRTRRHVLHGPVPGRQWRRGDGIIAHSKTLAPAKRFAV